MSLLDDLKKQANQANAKHAEDKSETLQKHQVNWNMLVPKLQLIITYMRELSENLNAVGINEKLNYSLTQNISLKYLTRENFRVRKVDEKSVREFSFRYDLVGERKIEIAVTNDFNAENIRNILRNQKIRFTEVITDQGKAQFTFLPKITIIFQYIADLQNCLVMLKIHNFNRPETQEIRYQPETITEGLMEETAKYILNKENKFSSLSGNVVNDETLQILRSKLKQDGKIPSGETKAMNEKQDSQAKKKSIFGKLLKK
jgi:hypothetical protein